MKSFLKIDKRVIELNDTQAFIYLLIVYKDWKATQDAINNKTFKRMVTITREYFAKCLNVSVTSVSNNFKKIEELGLIERIPHFNNAVKDGYINQTIEFKLNYTDNNWFKVNPFIINSKVEPKLKGFALRYRCLAFDDSLVVNYDKTECSKRMHISRPTFRKYLDLIQEANLINEFFIPVQNKNIKDNYLSESSMEYLREIQNHINKLKEGSEKDWIAFQNTAIYKQYKWIVKNRIWTRKNGDDTVIKMMSGLLNPPKKKEIAKTFEF